MAKVEWHAGELFPRVGFIVTNMTGWSRNAEATDATTMATGATLVYRVGAGLDQEWPIPYANPAEVDNVMLFDGMLDGLRVGEQITFHVNVFDGVGNMSSSEDELITLQLPIPTVSEWGMIIMALLALTAGTIVFARRRRPAVA